MRKPWGLRIGKAKKLAGYFLGSDCELGVPERTEWSPLLRESRMVSAMESSMKRTAAQVVSLVLQKNDSDEEEANDDVDEGEKVNHRELGDLFGTDAARRSRCGETG
jgi:hypothetical protein